MTPQLLARRGCLAVGQRAARVARSGRSRRNSLRPIGSRMWAAYADRERFMLRSHAARLLREAARAAKGCDVKRKLSAPVAP